MPQEKRGTLDDSFTLNVDLAETILGAAKIDPAPTMQGRAISDLDLTGENNQKQEPWRDEFYYEFPLEAFPSNTALLRKKWKYIYWLLEDYEQLLYLENDPFELNDLRNTSGVEAILKEMRTRYAELQDEIIASQTRQSPNVIETTSFLDMAGWLGDWCMCKTIRITYEGCYAQTTRVYY
jgi:arylsulfatase A-like enzyme